MEINWKRPAIAAGVAFFVAVVSAAIGHVRFGTLLFRSITGAIVFAALAVAAEVLAKKYLPELFDTSGGDSPDSDTGDNDEVSGTVDITLDAENPHAAESVLSAGDSPTNTAAPGTGEVGIVEDGEDVEELEAVETTEGELRDAEADSGGGRDASEGLPSFDGVESSFDVAGAHVSEEGSDGLSSISGSTAGIDILGQNEDAETVARAVRTLLKRDEEG